jgi:transcriptional regulator with XRE-family HTH domain
VPEPTPLTARERRSLAGIPSPSELAARVRAAREAAGLTAAEAGAILGISQQSYSERERSTNLPYPMALELIRSLGYDPAILYPEVARPPQED